ncbi:glycosyltransferase family 2 protein [Paenibacillus humicola]|uniref:glycosyltransferase family 2 protein n=1 Tax=Paenibacillus humicola TaxID=3110540 RepID=UPI00237BFD62|nr:glycosyltransferase family 2 protein [Paenibacillus humicola]
MNSERLSGRVSFVVPCYNCSAYVKECLDSLILQTYEDIEIIAVDDGSTDATWETIEQWKTGAPRKNPFFDIRNRFVALRLPRNCGYSGAMTTAMYLARGEFIATQDADDLSHAQRIEHQVNAMLQRPELGAVGTSYHYFRDGRFDSPERECWLKYGMDNIKASYDNGLHCVCHGTLLFRASLFDRLGGLTRRLPGAEDYEHIAHFIAAGERIDNLNLPLYYYRIHDKQRSHEYYG